jgi:hypothetical protein
MRSTRSARVAASIGTTSPSFRIIRSRSCSCTTTTSLTSVNSRLQKVIAKLAFLVEWWNYQRGEGQKSLLTQMRLLGDLHFGAIRQQHPDRNFQSPPSWIGDRDRSISPLGSAEDQKGSAVKRMERIENLDVRTFRAQGIVGVGAIIPMSTVRYQREAWRPIIPIGFALAILSSCR